MRTNVISWVLMVGMVVMAVIHMRGEPWPPMRVAGAGVCLVALVLLSVARYQLGASFSVSAQARQLVTTGLYSRIRNPIYVIAEFFLAGVALFLMSWWPLVMMAVLIPVQVMRARKEAAVLEGAFGEEYVKYRRATWF
jgi:protein-S-isoprenylcysteine O-methyltransferase Ste14